MTLDYLLHEQIKTDLPLLEGEGKHRLYLIIRNNELEEFRLKYSERHARKPFVYPELEQRVIAIPDPVDLRYRPQPDTPQVSDQPDSHINSQI